MKRTTQKQALKKTRAHLIKAMQTASPNFRLISVQDALHCTNPKDILPVDIRQLTMFANGYINEVGCKDMIEIEVQQHILKSFIQYIKEHAK